MKYLHEILWYASWPLLIAISYLAVKYALKKFEKTNRESTESGDYFDI